MNIKTEKLITGFYDQLQSGIKSGMRVKLNTASYRNFNDLVICGMGGSALPGDILKSWRFYLKKLNKNIVIHKNYRLPDSIKRTRRSLIICISYSGNTEETINAYQESIRHKYSVIAITSGGKLAQLAKKNKKPFILVPTGIPPRFALGYQLGAIIGLFAEANLISAKEKNSILKSAREIKYSAIKKLSLSASRKISDRIPVIYASEANKALAYLFKINFNENTKIPAFINFFPELNHNEFNSFAVLSKKQKHFIKNLIVIVLKDKKDIPEIVRRIRVTELFIKRSGVKLLEVKLDQASIFEKTFYCLILSQWISIFLAQKYGVNPLPTDLIERFKKELNK